MKNDKVFIRYYDNLYAGKDYTAEINQILDVWSTARKKKPGLILDVGSGTGNHSFQFARKGFKLLGVDIEKEMVAISKKKLLGQRKLKLDFRLADISTKKLAQPADLAFSFFFVINYITSLEYLVKFLKGVKRNLKSDGIYVFNSWNGNATVVDPPKLKQIDTVDGKVHITGTLNPRFDAKFNRSHFLYSLKINDGGQESAIEYEIHQVYWPPLVLREACLMAGFGDVRIFRHLTRDENFSSADYVLDFACYVKK